MGLVVVIANHKELCDAILLNLKGYLNIEASIYSSVKDVEELINSEEQISLLISMCEIENVKPVKDLGPLLKSLPSPPSIISLGDDPVEEIEYNKSKIYSTDQFDDVKKLIEFSADALGIDLENSKNIPSSKYFPIPLEHFFTLTKSPSDVFIKIGRGENTQYLKRIHQGEGLDKEDVDRYHSKGVASLYIENEKRLNFVNDLTQELLKTFDKKDSPADKVLKVTEIAQDTIAQNIKTLGITPEVAKMADKAIDKMIVQADNHPKLSKLLDKLTENKSSFKFKHTQITTYMCLSILRKVDWGSKEQYKTLSFVSFFHDICLPNDELTKIHSKKELDEAELNKKSADLVMKHAQLSAELIHNYPHMPMGADTIIRQHHGVLNGYGFSESFSGNLSPLVIVFIVAEECTHLVLKSENEKLNKRKIMYELETKFKTSRFQKMLEALEEVL